LVHKEYKERRKPLIYPGVFEQVKQK